MPTSILATKLYIPPVRPKAVMRPHLIEMMDEGVHRKLTLLSAAAGFGKTMLVSAWAAGCGRPFAWVSLDEGDRDPIRFLTYLVASIQTVAQDVGVGAAVALQSPQPPPIDSVLTVLLNEIAASAPPFVLVLDDYHLVDSAPIDTALTFLIEHLPPQMHVVIATREDPTLPLARLRARGQLTELRANDLRFTQTEAGAFLHDGMGLALSEADVAALEHRTEGWIAGLQLAALALKGTMQASDQEGARFIESFTGSHHFVLDYLVQEVLNQQPEDIQTFLLHTSILDRLCGPLCEAVAQSHNGQQTLEMMEQANLFIIPLDNERRWYRYHHLFAELLRQRLQQSVSATGISVSELHIRASEWYEGNGFEIEAFQHAAAAGDLDRAARLVEGGGMPLHFRGAVLPVFNWLASLPDAALNAHPALWVIFGSVLLFVGDIGGVESKLRAAEAVLDRIEDEEYRRDQIGHIAAIRATIAVSQHDGETISAQAHRALETLHPNNLPVRTSMTWALGYAHHLQGDRAAAERAYREAIAISEAIGHFIIHLSSMLGLGLLTESDNQLDQAVQIYQQVIKLAGDPPPAIVADAYLGLARISYERNDLSDAEQHYTAAEHLARQMPTTDRHAACQLFLVRLKLAQGDVEGAAAVLAQVENEVRQHQFIAQMPDLIAAQVQVMLAQGDVEAAGQIAAQVAVPMSQARVHLARGSAADALTVLEALREQVEALGWADIRLRTMVLQALAHHANRDSKQAVRLIGEVLAVAGGFVRLFIDEGAPMADLLAAAAGRGVMADAANKLLAVMRNLTPKPDQRLVDPLSDRELEILRLTADGLSNREIGERLFISLSTVKGHNQRIFDKLQVQRRTEAIARARELGLI